MPMLVRARICPKTPMALPHQFEAEPPEHPNTTTAPGQGDPDLRDDTKPDYEDSDQPFRYSVAQFGKRIVARELEQSQAHTICPRSPYALHRLCE